MENQRSRSWCLTINNYTPEIVTQLKEMKNVQYIIVGDEVGTNGTPHLQIYFRLKTQKTFSKIKKEYPTAHIERAIGNDADNRKYCSKQIILYESGEVSTQGTRTDLHGIKDMLIENPKISHILDNLTNYQQIRTAEKLLTYVEPKRNWKPEVLWYYGPSGSGKSRRAYEEHPDAYTAMDTGNWWEGYDGDEVVVIDDMRKDFLKFHQLLKLLDRYPYRVEVKGGSRQFLAKTIIITSCYSPREMWENKTDENLTQLIRRIDKIIYFDNI